MSYVSTSPAQYPGMITPTASVSPTIQSNYNGVPPDTMTTAEERMKKFAQIAVQHEINREFASRLRQLEGYEIVFLCDDSGSMATAVGEFYYFFLFYINNVLHKI